VQAQGWFFLAMTHWRLDDKDAARQWYDKAVGWMDTSAPQNGTLLGLRDEAQALLKSAPAPQSPKPAAKEKEKAK
jgi:hypothetical protein